MKYIITEEQDKKKRLFDYAKLHGLSDAYTMVGGRDNYINFLYDGDIVSFFKNESEAKPYYFISNPPNMYINELIVDSLNLPEDGHLKSLGKFRYGKEGNMSYVIEAKLTKGKRGDGDFWKVIAIGGSRGFGYSFMNEKDVLGPKYRKQIFKQLIDKYNLKDYK